MINSTALKNLILNEIKSTDNAINSNDPSKMNDVSTIHNLYMLKGKLIGLNVVLDFIDELKKPIPYISPKGYTLIVESCPKCKMKYDGRVPDQYLDPITNGQCPFCFTEIENCFELIG